MKILLIEDDIELRYMLLSVLESRHHTVEEAGSAEEALARLPGDYHLVISDILLGKMDGITFLERVNRMQPRVPVVMITGLQGRGLTIEAECREKGAAGFFHKPFNIRTLLNLVEEVGKTGP